MRAAEGTALHDLTDGKVDISRNFQLHALEGMTGEPRWRNAGLDFRKDLDRLEQVPPSSFFICVCFATLTASSRPSSWARP